LIYGILKRMKILIIRTFPDILDIQSYNVQEIGLAKALIRKGHICDIALYGGKEADHEQRVVFDKSDEGEAKSFTIYWLKGMNFFKNGFLYSVKKLIPNYDVIQVAEYDQIGSWGLYTKQLVPTVMYHGLYASTYTRGYNFKCAVFDKLFLWRRPVSKVVALSKSELAADFLRDKGFENIKAVGVGIDDERFRVLLDKKHREKCHIDGNVDIISHNSEPKSDNNPFKLLYIGKIEDRRNSLWLIDLLEELVYNRGLKINMTIIGRGETDYQKAFEEKSSKLIQDKILTYIPKATQEEMPDIYSSRDMFVFPSNYEIFGMVLLEAMYFGLPVISSFNGGSSTLIKDGVNGLIQRDFDIQKWADRIEEFWSDRKNEIYSNMGIEANNTIKNGFLWDKLADKFLESYSEAIEKFNSK